MTETKVKEDRTHQQDSSPTKDVPEQIRKLFDAGAHYGNRRALRHPSTEKYIFGTKNTVEIFDLDKTQAALEKAQEFMKKLGEKNGQVLFVSSKREARDVLLESAKKLDMPYVTNRWVGGTLTNFKEIRKRVDLLEELREKKESGALDKYTKHEQLLISRDIESLERKFGGRVDMKKLPKAMVVIDPAHEEVAVAEAVQKNIPIVALASSDCDISDIEYPIPGNDASTETTKLVLGALVAAYEEGRGNEKKKNQKKEE